MFPFNAEVLAQDVYIGLTSAEDVNTGPGCTHLTLACIVRTNLPS